MKLTDIRIGLRVKCIFSAPAFFNKIGTITSIEHDLFRVKLDNGELTCWYLSEDRSNLFEIYIPDDMS